MTPTPATRRPGISLTEVLVALFVMALGLISLLTLFPVGAVQIGVALKQDRCTTTAIQADAYLRAYWQKQVVEQPGTDPQVEPFVLAFEDPNLQSRRPPTTTEMPNVNTNPYPDVRINTYFADADRLPGLSSPPGPKMQLPTKNATTGAPTASTTAIPPGDTYFDVTDPTVYNQPAAPTPAVTPLDNDPNVYVYHPPALATGSSYPVFIDPLGFFARTGQRNQYWVGRPASAATAADLAKDGLLLMPRRNLALVASGTTAIQRCSLLDDLTFDTNGVPLNETPSGSTPTITRQGRYNWAAVIQRSNLSDRTRADLKILCFDGRVPLTADPDSELVVTPGTSAAPVTLSGSSITLTMPTLADPASPSPFRKGGWFMDGTISYPAGAATTRNANFYRIVGVTESATPGDFVIDFEPPVTTAVTNPTLYFFAGLAEVYTRPPLKPLSSN